ncbi:hypothetical protein AMAG_13311 [Allomyces macrogynus ATCC 38327]|uniref:Uncharacterized protein n=1 Tax=Allomyces macrogynus (strain ATCC 38327) TaxID=578462 RepID=A0A0L0T0H1_ALLM3|nr:hypothetical protein AMAG_13311 [Allomyces macrogynus ATCC 38327]|eukprot:KNE68145.1 hypothetical protein AMAG_13311 [Allomyces macrogynus ATCC 38327]
MADDGSSDAAAPPAARLVIAIPPPPGSASDAENDTTSPPRPSLTLTVATPTPASETSVDVFHDALDSLSATAAATSAPTARRVQFPTPRTGRSPPHRRPDGALHHPHTHAHAPHRAHGVAASGAAPPRHPPRSLADLDAVLSDEELLLDDDDDDDDDHYDDHSEDDDLAFFDDMVPLCFLS